MVWFLVSRCQFSWIIFVEPFDGLRGVVEVGGQVPSFILIVKPLPPDSILKGFPVVAGVCNFFDFPLFLVVDDDWQRRGLEVSGDWNISSCCGFRQRYVKYWMDLYAGGKVQFICFGAYLFEDGIGAYMSYPTFKTHSKNGDSY
jgi:hypothetical protein